jgi:hypothetical protein
MANEPAADDRSFEQFRNQSAGRIDTDHRVRDRA